MACILGGGPAADSGARALQSCMEMMLLRLTEEELEQVMKSLGSGCEGGKEEIDVSVFSIDEQGRTIIKIPAH